MLLLCGYFTLLLEIYYILFPFLLLLFLTILPLFTVTKTTSTHKHNQHKKLQIVAMMRDAPYSKEPHLKKLESSTRPVYFFIFFVFLFSPSLLS